MTSSSDSGSSSTDNTTSVTTPTITGGGAEPGATVTLYDTNGVTVLGTATADGSGNWSIISSSLSDGQHTLTAKVTDTSGNTSSASNGLTLTVDSTAPTASGGPVLDSASDSGRSSTDNITNVTTPTIKGSGAEPGATVTLYDTDGTTVLGRATADGAGHWSITSSPLSEGQHTLTTKVTDTAGNTGSASSGLTVTIDTTVPPQFRLSQDSVLMVETGIRMAVANLTSTDGTVIFALASGDGINDSGNSSFVISQGVLQSTSTLNPGKYSVRVSATDTAGNISYQNFVFTVIGLPPTNDGPKPESSPIKVDAPVRPSETIQPSKTSFISTGTVNAVPVLAIDPVQAITPVNVLVDPMAPIQQRAVVSLGVSNAAGSSVSGLRAIEASREVNIERGEQVTITLPAGTFVHSDASARVSLSARLADGRPLPSYVKFNPTTGTITVEGGGGENAEQLQVVVNAVDEKGQSASTTVVIKLKEKTSNSSAIELPIKLGKPALSEQIKLKGKAAGALADLAALSKAFAASQSERTRA